MTFTIKPIRTKKDHEKALKRIEEILNVKPGTPEEDELDILTDLVQAYEDKNYPLSPIDPIEAIKYYIEKKGLKQKDLIPYIGTAEQLSEVLSGKRKLTIKIIKKLHKVLDIPYEYLLDQKSFT